MTRVKRGKIALKRRKNVLKQTKGFRNARKSKERQAHEALFKAGSHAFAHRKDKKSDFRGLWQIHITGGLKKHELSYSKFMSLLKKKDILLNRKMLSELIQNESGAFDRIVAEVK